jgi:hypothetical protein
MAQQIDIPFGTLSSKGERPRLGGSRYINAILEAMEDERTIRKRAPGLRRFITSIGGYTHTRGLIGGNSNTLLVVYDGRVESVTLSDGVTTSEDRGALAGTDLVTLARNNNATPQIVGVSPANGAFVLTVGGAPASYPDADVGSPNSVCFIDGYFFFTYGNGRCIASGINSTAVNPLDIATAQSTSDGLIRGIPYRGQLLLCSYSTIEAWQNTGNETGFPFTRATVIPRGLISANAIAGHEDKFTSSLMWVGSDNIVYLLNGYSPTRVSTHDLEHDIQALADKTTLRVFVFMNNGHPFWCLKCADWTHVYDLLTSTWGERRSYGSLTWRAEQSHFMWGDWIVGDETTGHLFRPDNEAYYEDTTHLVYEVESGATANFPNRMAIQRTDFDFVAGVGNAGGNAYTDQDPEVEISWSDDGGATWSYPVTRALGKQGEYLRRVTVNRGRTSHYGRKYRLRVSDRVFVGLLGGKMHVEGLAS